MERYSIDLAVDLLDRRRRTRHADDRMQDAEAAAIGLETGPRDGFGLEIEPVLMA